MQPERPDRLIDPVCGMAVRVDAAEQDGLLLELGGRTYAFCRPACRDDFVAAPERYVAAAGERATAPAAAHAHAGPHRATAQPALALALPVIDEGLRRWYESCSCCLSDAYPEIKARLDAERAAAAQPPVGAGICEIAEAEAEPATR